MEDTPAEAEKPAAAAPTRTRKAPARRKAASATKKAPARRKSPARKRPAAAAKTSNGFSALLNEMAAKASAAGKELKALSGKGAGAARKTIARLTREWEGMDSTRRAQFVAALLTALAAAASAPIVRGRLKK